MNFSRHLTVFLLVAGCLVLVVGMWPVSNGSLPPAQMVQFGTPQDVYGVTVETGFYTEGERTAFIAGVRAALRDVPEKVVLEKEEAPAPTPVPAPIPERVPPPVVPIVSQIAEIPAVVPTPFEATTTTTTSATTTYDAHVHVHNPAL